MGKKEEEAILTPHSLEEEKDEYGSNEAVQTPGLLVIGPAPASEMLTQAKTRKKKFRELLDGLSTVDEKKKYLWYDIYTNAFKEIDMAYRLFDEAVAATDLTVDINHSELGPTLVKYLERASKANEQLLKLVNMIEEVEQKENELELDQLRNHAGLGKNII